MGRPSQSYHTFTCKALRPPGQTARRARCDRAEVTARLRAGKEFLGLFPPGWLLSRLAERSKPSEFLGNDFPPNTSLPRLCSVYLGPSF